jgi:hypothetical protein
MVTEKTKPKRIQRKRTKGYKSPKGSIYVGRPTEWGNPFTVGCDAWRFSIHVPFWHPENIEQVLADYRYLCKMMLYADPKWLAPLRGKDLSCWCNEEDSCHADILLELANG